MEIPLRIGQTDDKYPKPSVDFSETASRNISLLLETWICCNRKTHRALLFRQVPWELDPQNLRSRPATTRCRDCGHQRLSFSYGEGVFIPPSAGRTTHYLVPGQAPDTNGLPKICQCLIQGTPADAVSFWRKEQARGRTNRPGSQRIRGCPRQPGIRCPRCFRRKDREVLPKGDRVAQTVIDL